MFGGTGIALLDDGARFLEREARDEESFINSLAWGHSLHDLTGDPPNEDGLLILYGAALLVHLSVVADCRRGFDCT